MDREIEISLKRGSALLKKNRILEAQRAFYRAVDASGKESSVKLQAAELWRKAGWATLMGRDDPENGWTMFHNARALYQSLDGLGSPALWEVERGMAIAAGRMGDPEESLRLCEEAEGHAQTPEQRAKVLNTKAIALSYLGRPGDSQVCVERVLETSKDASTIRVARQSLGMIHLVLRRPELALRYLEDPTLRAWANLEAGQYREVLKLKAKERPRAHLLRARAFLALGQPKRATGELKRGIRVIEDDREKLMTESALTSFQGAREETYSLLVKVTAERGRLEEAFQYAEASRARSFLDFLVDLEFEGRRDLTHLRPGEQQRFGSLRGRMDELEGKNRRSAVDDRELSRLQGEYRMSLRRYQKEQQAEREVLPVYPEKAKSVRAGLAKGDAVLQYHIVDDGVWAFLLTRKAFSARRLTREAKDVLDAARELARAIAVARRGERIGSRAFFDWHFADLGEALLGELPLEGIERLSVVPHGPLHLVPFGALRLNGRYIIERLAVSLSPSASVGLTLLEKAAGAAAPARCLLVKDPSQTLAHADREEQVLRTRFGKNLTVLAGDAATREAVIASTPGHHVVHISTHAVFRPERPEFSYLELGSGQKLYASDLVSVDLTSARVVTLSACESGRGDFSRASEMVGLPRAFLLAGAQAVFATLWPVEDHPGIASLMERFYADLARAGVARAAAVAQREALALGIPPSVWASFAVIGN